MLTARFFSFYGEVSSYCCHISKPVCFYEHLEKQKQYWKHCLKGPWVHLVSSPAQNGVVANPVSDFFSILALWVPSLENENKFLKAEGKGRTYPLSCKEIASFGCYQLACAIWSHAFSQGFVFYPLSLLLTDGDIGVSLGEPSWFWHSCHLAHDK